MNTVLFPAGERGQADYGWLKTNYSFSFANWHDPNKLGFGRLRVLNDDKIAPGQGFGTHSHQNMEIITIILKGTLEHKDSLGNVGQITAGEVQVMSAGTGVAHSEYNPSEKDEVELFQLWIYPEKYNIQPRYDQKYVGEGEKNQWMQIVGPLNSSQKVLEINQQAYISLIQLDKESEAEYTFFNPKNCVYFMIIDGVVDVDRLVLNKRDAMGLSYIGGETIKLVAKTWSKVLAVEVPN